MPYILGFMHYDLLSHDRPISALICH